MNMGTEKNTPKLRFPEFTDDWEQRKLGELIEDKTILEQSDGNHGELYPRSEEFTEKGIPYIAASSIASDGESINFSLTKYLPVERAKQFRKGVAKNGDILLAHNATVGPSVKLSMDFEFAVLSTSLTLYRLDEEKMNADFFLQAIRSSYFQSQLQVLMKQTTRSQVPILTQRHLKICFPKNIDEQIQVGSFLINLDNLITLHQRKCDDLKKMKQGMLQKMFPKEGKSLPEIRFPGFTDEWERRKLGDFGKATGGTSIESEFSEDGKYKVINIGSYSEDSVYRDQGIRAVESEKTKNRVLNKDDITMILNDKTSSGNIIGRVLLIEESGVYVYNQRTERIEIDHNNYDALFVYEMLNAPQIRDKIVKQSQGNTQIYINWSTIAETDYLVPRIDEQRYLGKFFLNLDNLINLHQRKCDELKHMKKSLLQQMFI